MTATACRLALVVLLLVAAGAASEAAAQAACGPRAQIRKHLGAAYGERPLSMALTTKGDAVIELWTAPDGSWTLLKTSVHGYACILAAGRTPWEPQPQGDPL